MAGLSKLVCAGLGLVLAGTLGAEAAGWDVKSGQSDRNAGYVQGVARDGKIEFWITCFQDMRQVDFTLLNLPMPASTEVAGAGTQFKLEFDLGAGVTSTIYPHLRYSKRGPAWSGDVGMDANDREAFGAAKSMRLIRADGKQLAVFPAKGSRKMQKLMQKKCFDNPMKGVF